MQYFCSFMNRFLIILFITLIYNRNDFSLAEDPSRYRLKQFAINETALSVTSFIFNLKATRPPLWVDRQIGDEAVYWHGTRIVINPNISESGNVLQNYHERFEKFADNFTVLESDLRPSCYVEMLAFARLGETFPFHVNDSRDSGPSVGYGKLSVLPSKSSKGGYEGHLKCYYRGVYSNARRFDFDDTFWAVLIYCPMLSKSGKCEKIEKMYDISPDSVQFQLTLITHPLNWTIDLETYRESSMDFRFEKIRDKEKLEQKLAVCTVWPYATKYEDKVLANQALVYEFLRYYSNLGIKLMVYDRDGLNMKGVFESDYALANPERGRYRGSIERHLTYFNYTIASVLLPESGNSRSDMEGELNDTIARMDNDKSLTYDHCRFELKARYGITRVIVIDFDEFLYCKAAAPTAEAQSAYIHKYLADREHEGFDQVSFGKTTIASKVYGIGSVHDCVMKELALNSARVEALNAEERWSWRNILGRKDNMTSNYKYRQEFLRAADKNKTDPVVSSVVGSNIDAPGSVFNCFGSIKFIDDYPNVKSIQMNHGCPQTSMHHTCVPCRWSLTSICMFTFHSYDCLCQSQRSFTCDFMHLSLVEDKYFFDSKKNFTPLEVRSMQSEPYFIANAQ